MTAATAYASYKPARKDAGQPGNNSVVTDLVACARGGDIQAWDTLVKRYTPLIASICRRYQLGRADADDVRQRVWLCLVNHLDKIRQPAALPGWIATTTRRECERLVRGAQSAGWRLRRLATLVAKGASPAALFEAVAEEACLLLRAMPRC